MRAPRGYGEATGTHGISNMWFLLLACTGAPKDDSTSTSLGPLEEGLPTAFATFRPSCDEVDGPAWLLVVGEASATCPGAAVGTLTDVIRFNVAGPQEGPDEGGVSVDLSDAGYSWGAWTRAGEDGVVTAGSVVVDPWDAAAGTLTGSLEITATFGVGEVRGSGTFSAIYCAEKVLCG